MSEERMQKSMEAVKAASAPPTIPDVASQWRPAAQKRRAERSVIEDAFDSKVVFNLAFLGVGQGGGRIASSFYDLGYRRVAVLNTTDADFDGLPEGVLRHSFQGGGARKDRVFAAKQLDGREEEVWDLLTRAWGADVDYGLVCMSLGGGTGSGMGPPLVKLARRYLEDQGRLPRVGAIISLPKVVEGPQVARNALGAFNELIQMGVSPLIVVDNYRVQQRFSPVIRDLYPTANKLVASYLHLFNQLCERPDVVYSSFDRSEFSQLLDNGLVVMGATPVGTINEINNPADITTAIREDLANGVLATVDLRTGHIGACLFVASQAMLDQYGVEYFDAGFSQMKRTIGSKSDQDPILHTGVYESPHEMLSAYTMVAGLQPPHKRLQELAKEAQMFGQPISSTMAKFLGVND